MFLKARGLEVEMKEASFVTCGLQKSPEGEIKFGNLVSRISLQDEKKLQSLDHVSSTSRIMHSEMSWI
jgi:hypothetical protein